MKKILLFSFATLLTIKVVIAQSEVTFYTSLGDFVVETYDTLQPITAGNFIDLVNAEFYDGIIFHRVIPGFVIQGGDPLGTGYGGPGYTIPDEFDPLTSNVQKALSMANAGPNTGGSQFFINLVDNLFLDADYPVFGIVISNFSVVEEISLVPTNNDDKPLTDVVMDSLRVTHTEPLGINDRDPQTLYLSVFPNPTDEQITISLGDKFTFGNEFVLKVINVLGETIYSEPLYQKQTSINISAIAPKGIYFVNVMDKRSNLRGVKKVILQ